MDSTLDHRVRSVSVHHIYDGVHDFVAAYAEDRRTEEFLRLPIHEYLDEALCLVAFTGAPRSVWCSQQGFTIRGLLEASRQLDDKRYFDAARAAYAFMNEQLWDTATGV